MRRCRGRHRHRLHASGGRARHVDGRAVFRQRPHLARRRLRGFARPRLGARRRDSVGRLGDWSDRRVDAAHVALLMQDAMARAFYTLLWWIALPLLPLRLWWRGRKEPGYRRFIGERFGRYLSVATPGPRDVLWIHAVSLGETRA